MAAAVEFDALGGRAGIKLIIECSIDSLWLAEELSAPSDVLCLGLLANLTK
jgi:hypothetical protein